MSPCRSLLNRLRAVFTLVVVCLLAFLSSSITRAAEFTSVSHDLYVNSSGDIYLKARDRIVLLHGSVAVPITLAPTESSYYIGRQSNQEHGYAAAVAYDENTAPLSLAGYTEYAGLRVIDYNDEDHLYVPKVGAIPHSLVLNGGTSSATLVASNVTLGDFDYLVDNAPSPAANPNPSLPAGSDQIGSINGSFRVNESGAATYSIPLMSAPGVAGVAPTLSLNYSSQGGNGLLGQGWSLSGLSSISRCRQTYQQDMNPQPIKWNKDDRFCLDGQRLVLASGAKYGDNNSTYRTEIDSFAIVTLKTSGGEPDYFEVTRKDGSTSYYGAAGRDNARQSEFRPENISGSGLTSGDVLTWSIREFKDNVNNRIEFSYNNSATTGHRISSIKYAFSGGAAGAETTFGYDFNRGDKTQGYIAGKQYETTARLTTVSVKNDRNTLRNYRLDYRAPSGVAVQDDTSRIWAIKECAVNDNGSDSCLPATKFNWTIPNHDELLSHTGRPELTLTDKDTETLLQHEFGDINGDGYQDVAWLLYREMRFRVVYDVKYALFDPETGGWKNRGSLSAHMPGDPLKGDAVSLSFADYNADGRSDLYIWHGATSSLSIFVSQPELTYNNGKAEIAGGWELSVGSVAGPSQKVSRPAYTDLNADGLVDLITRDASYSYRWLGGVVGVGERQLEDVTSLKWRPLVRDESKPLDSSTLYHYGEERSVSLVDPDQSEDFNTDEELEYRYNLLGASQDFNGDGVGDFLIQKSSNFTELDSEGLYVGESGWIDETRVGISQLGADGNIESIHLIRGAVFQGLGGPALNVPADFNGDGLLDLLTAGSSGSWTVQLGTGLGFEPLVQADGSPMVIHTSESVEDAEEQGMGIADLNRDGYSDIYWREEEKDRLQVTYWKPDEQTFDVVQDSRIVTEKKDEEPVYPFGVDGHPFPFIPEAEDPAIRYPYQLLAIDPHEYVDGVYLDREADSGAKIVPILAGKEEQNEPRNLIVKITNGLGAETDITYEPMSGSESYKRVEGVGVSVSPLEEWCILNENDLEGDELCFESRRSTADVSGFYTEMNTPFNYLSDQSTTLSVDTINPVLELSTPLPIVTRVESSSPSVGNVSDTAAIDYEYGQAKIQAGGRGMLGFRHLTTIDPNGVKTTTTYRQDWPFIGSPLSSVTFSPDGDILSSATNSWDLATIKDKNGTPHSMASAQQKISTRDTSGAGGTSQLAVVQPFLAVSIEKTYDADAALRGSASVTPLTTLITETEQDEWGNPTKVTQTQYEGEGELGRGDWLLETITENEYAPTASTFATTKDWVSSRYGRLMTANVTTIKKSKVGAQVSENRKYGRSSFEYDNGNGLLKSETVHYLPDSCTATTAANCGQGIAQLSLTTSHAYDHWGNIISMRGC